MGFWILALLGALVVLAILGRAMLAPSARASAASAEFDLQVYRDQLKELDRDLARGTIAPEEAQRARVEISRRLLEADRAAQTGEATGRAPRAATYSALALAGALVLGGGAWLYSDIGAPGYWDMPLTTRFAAAETARIERPSQATTEADLPAWAGPPADAPADYVALVEKLRLAVTSRPDDMQGQMLLATHETQLGNYRAAHAAMKRVLDLKAATVTADDWAQYLDLLVLAAGGYVSPEAEAAAEAALALNPRDAVALYYIGLMNAQVGRPDIAFRIWRDLLESSAPSEPWVAPIRSQIMSLAQLAGVDYTPPSSGPGPSAADMAAAADMTPEERAAMVGGMVNQLMERLATEGGPASDWARLIQVLGVQGDTARAATIWSEAQSVFAGRADDLATINDAAAQAGLTEPTAPGAAAPEAPAPQAAAPGPSADQVEAAGDMTPQERAAMIDGMVTRLADEIGTNGGTPEQWARLINAYGVMGEADSAQRAWDNAQIAYEGDAAGLATIRAAAVAAGVAE